MKIIRITAKAAEFVAGVGIDTMITTAANQVIPKSYGVFGTAQKICVKAGSIGLSIVATRALEKTVDEYLDEIEAILNGEEYVA